MSSGAKGIGLIAPGKKRDGHAAWLAALENQSSDRILGLDVETAKLCGKLTACARKKGRVIPATDGLLAVTAPRYGPHVMTRNECDFQASGDRIVNPRHSND